MTSPDKAQRLVAYLGPPASYSHQATLQEFTAKLGYELESVPNIRDVFESIQSGRAFYGVVPFENSSYGSVIPTLELLADRCGELLDVQICGEIYVDIDHYLVGFGQGKHEEERFPGDATPTLGSPNPEQPRVQPLKDISHVQRVLSHGQGFGQCSAFLGKYLKGVETQEINSTSKAAEIVAKSGNYTFAAIASKNAAEVHGLTVLAKCIQDANENKTRFFVIKHSGSPQQPQDPNVKLPDFLKSGSKSTFWRSGWKSLVAFTIPHQAAGPGALADALNVFKANGLNITSINTRPSHLRPWHYIFFIEFEGRLEEDGSGSVNNALAGLEEYAERFRMFGSWKNRDKSTQALLPQAALPEASRVT